MNGSFPVEQTTKGTPISNGEDQLSHLHPKELRRWILELDVIGYAISLSQIRWTPKFVDSGGGEEERCA
jgi:hypothetical protein